MPETDADEAATEVGFGLIEALAALAGAIAAAVSGDVSYAAAGFGLASAVLASRLMGRPAPRARRLAAVLSAAVAVTIVLLLANLAVAAALVAVSTLVAATLVVARAAPRGGAREGD